MANSPRVILNASSFSVRRRQFGYNFILKPAYIVQFTQRGRIGEKWTCSYSCVKANFDNMPSSFAKKVMNEMTNEMLEICLCGAVHNWMSGCYIKLPSPAYLQPPPVLRWERWSVFPCVSSVNKHWIKATVDQKPTSCNLFVFHDKAKRTQQRNLLSSLAI